MTGLSSHSPDHPHLHRQGWVYSVVFHALMGAAALALMPMFTSPLEPDSFKWNVALSESPSLQPTVDPLPHATPTPPPKLQSVKSRSTPLEATKPIQSHMTQHRPTQAIQDVTEVTPVNHTASPIMTKTVEYHEVSRIEEPVTPQKRGVEEPAPANDRALNEPVTPPASQSIIDSVAQQPTIEETREIPAPARQPATEQVVASTAPLTAAHAVKADYGWLMKQLLGRVNELKQYPHMARMNHWEGKVVLRAVIKDDGRVLMVDVQESSGRSILDVDAMETLKKASPLKLDHPLGKPYVAILMPISYSLR